MKVSLLLLSMITSLYLVGCRENPSSSHTHENKIELNAGEKWKVNPEMMPLILASEDLLTDYRLNGGNDHTELASQLRSNNEELISSCTMTGRSHEELHKWLHPHMELVGKLESAQNEKRATELIQELESSFKTFHQYFE